MIQRRWLGFVCPFHSWGLKRLNKGYDPLMARYKTKLYYLFTGTDVYVSEAEWQLLKNFSANFDSHLSSVSDYVPAAISCQDSQTMINARVY